MSFRYIGSKARLARLIGDRIGKWDGEGRFIDAFCGTGAVAVVAVEAGWPIHLNDQLVSATIMAAARFISKSEAPFVELGGYQRAIKALNAEPAKQGFIWREYSPASAQHLGFERRYFREENAGRIDAMRALINDWRREQKLSGLEERLLIADLLAATNRVANIAGTFGCFMAKWTSQADEAVRIRPRDLRADKVDMTISAMPADRLAVDLGDTVYIDPPYTKRQYASYYHILETVAIGDSPEVVGVSGLRPWKDRASEFCYKARALEAIRSLVAGLSATRILLSYSDDAHVPIDRLRSVLQELGAVESHVLAELVRYQPNRSELEIASFVREYLFEVEREARAPWQRISA